MLKSKTTRNSGIELMKVLAIVLIVINHVVQTLGEGNPYISYSDYVVNLNLATKDIQTFAIIVLRYSGAFANNVFFICSAWFLLESQKVNQEKLLLMIVETWSVSVIMLGFIYLLRGGVNGRLILKALFPYTFATNWYIVCYTLFYAIHPMLNHCILQLKQEKLLKIATILGILYCGCNYFVVSFYGSTLILWIALYFMIAYFKKYLFEICDNLKVNIIFFLGGIAGNILIISITNALGLKIGFLEDKMLYWDKECSPFLLLAVFALFNIGRNLHFRSKWVNYVAKLSLLIYIIHENILVRTYIRPYLWECIYYTFGYEYILCWTLGMSAAIFIVSVVLSALYKKTIEHLIILLIPKLYKIICKVYKRYEQLVIVRMTKEK